MEILFNPIKLLMATAKDVLPVLMFLVLFQLLVLRRPLPRPGRIVSGFCLVLVGMACFLGGITTSTVTVPLVAALGLGLASSIPGRSQVLDGFGLIAFASLFPIISVLGYAQFVQWKVGRNNRARLKEKA